MGNRREWEGHSEQRRRNSQRMHSSFHKAGAQALEAAASFTNKAGGLSTCGWERVRRHTPPWSWSPHVFQGRGIQGPTEFLSSHALLSNPSRAPVDSGAYHGLPSLLSKLSLLLHLSKYQLVIVSPSHMGLWIKILIHTCTH